MQSVSRTALRHKRNLQNRGETKYRTQLRENFNLDLYSAVAHGVFRGLTELLICHVEQQPE